VSFAEMSSGEMSCANCLQNWYLQRSAFFCWTTG